MMLNVVFDVHSSQSHFASRHVVECKLLKEGKLYRLWYLKSEEVTVL